MCLPDMKSRYKSCVLLIIVSLILTNLKCQYAPRLSRWLVK